ncbi:uncharacterized protein F4817DRAFT_369621 [Daldinia loculata]|uniref:uncharacterized protein n=1 Tax=Daldinia loculata TaxID=103429 RepID=UPI0020C2FB8A|nr:uncharacterized protein F4817DRAFT_369621 [Daldinia loculata]KAI1642240.1 hypothetical protein F4817DRAFT_369621 [Daldinia loculata]
MFSIRPDYTEENIPDLSSKVYIVTGANTGLDKEVTRILFHKNATVWIAVRNKEEGRRAIKSIRKASPRGSWSFYTWTYPPESSVRVVYVSSSSAEHMIPMEGGVDMDNLDYKKDIFCVYKHGVSKADPIVHRPTYGLSGLGVNKDQKALTELQAFDPGALKTDLDRHFNALEMLYGKAIVKPVIL